MLLTLKSASAAVPPAVLTVTAHVPDTPEGFLPFDGIQEIQDLGVVQPAMPLSPPS